MRVSVSVWVSLLLAAAPLLAVARLLAGCSVDELALDGKACPCVEGFTCDVARNTCVHGERDLRDLSDASFDHDAFCADATFCDGFERPSSDVIGPWEKAVGGSALSIQPDGGSRRTNGGFLRVALPAGATGGALLRPMVAASIVRLAFSLRVFDVQDRKINIGAVRYEGDGTKDILLVLDSSEGPRIRVVEQEFADPGVSLYTSHMSMPMPVGRWVDVVIQVNQDSTPPVLMVDFDGARVVDAKTLTIAIRHKTPVIVGGSQFASPEADSGTSVFDIDDVRVDIAPP